MKVFFKSIPLACRVIVCICVFGVTADVRFDNLFYRFFFFFVLVFAAFAFFIVVVVIVVVLVLVFAFHFLFIFVVSW